MHHLPEVFNNQKQGVLGDPTLCGVVQCPAHATRQVIVHGSMLGSCQHKLGSCTLAPVPRQNPATQLHTRAQKNHCSILNPSNKTRYTASARDARPSRPVVAGRQAGRGHHPRDLGCFPDRRGKAKTSNCNTLNTLLSHQPSCTWDALLTADASTSSAML